MSLYSTMQAALHEHQDAAPGSRRTCAAMLQVLDRGFLHVTCS